MGMSPEYPDLLFVPPAAFGKGRPWANTPRVIVVHYTAGSERSTSAEDGAAYDARRTDGTSCHYFVDADSVVQCVKTTDRANSALYNGNRIGIQYELCGTVQTRVQWLDVASDATLVNAARQIARDCAKWNIPVRKLTAAQVAAGMAGICGHADITLAFPEDGGDHMDPGTAFPWDVLLARIQQFAAPTVTTYATDTTDAAAVFDEEDDMPDQESFQLDPGFACDEAGNFLPGKKALVASRPVDPGAGYTTWISATCEQGTVRLRVAVDPDGVSGWSVHLVSFDSNAGRANLATLVGLGGNVSIARCRTSAADLDDQTPVGVTFRTGRT